MNKKNKKSLSKLKLVIILAILVAIGLLTWQKYVQKGLTDQEEGVVSDNDVLLVETTKRSGTVMAPDYIEPETLMAVSLGDVSEVSPNGDIEVPVYDGGVTAVMAVIPDNEFVLLDVPMGDEEPEISIQSTAEAMVFLSPQLVSPDMTLATEIMEIIKKSEMVKQLAVLIEQDLKEGKDPLDNPIVVESYTLAIQGVVNQLSE